MSSVVFEVKCGPSGQWYVRELAGGQTSNHSETYSSKQNAKRAAKRRSERTPGSIWRVVEWEPAATLD